MLFAIVCCCFLICIGKDYWQQILKKRLHFQYWIWQQWWLPKCMSFHAQRAGESLEVTLERNQFPNHSRRIGAISNWAHEGGIWKRRRVAEEQRVEARRKLGMARGWERFMQPVECHHPGSPSTASPCHHFCSAPTDSIANYRIAPKTRPYPRAWDPVRKSENLSLESLCPLVLWGWLQQFWASLKYALDVRPHLADSQILHHDPFTISAKRLQKNYESITTLKPS